MPRGERRDNYKLGSAVFEVRCQLYELERSKRPPTPNRTECQCQKCTRDVVWWAHQLRSNLNLFTLVFNFQLFLNRMSERARFGVEREKGDPQLQFDLRLVSHLRVSFWFSVAACRRKGARHILRDAGEQARNLVKRGNK